MAPYTTFTDILVFPRKEATRPLTYLTLPPLAGSKVIVGLLLRCLTVLSLLPPVTCRVNLATLHAE